MMPPEEQPHRPIARRARPSTGRSFLELGLRLGLLAATLSAIGLGTLGCDTPPTCEITGTLGGAFVGPIEWGLEGSEACGLADTAVFDTEGPVFVFLQKAGDEYQQLIVQIESPVIGVGEFPGRVLFVTPNDLYDSDAQGCTVLLTSYEVEPWSKTDFIAFEGIVDCAATLEAVSGGAGITLSTTALSGHVLDREMSFQNL